MTRFTRLIATVGKHQEFAGGIHTRLGLRSINRRRKDVEVNAVRDVFGSYATSLRYALPVKAHGDRDIYFAQNFDPAGR